MSAGRIPAMYRPDPIRGLRVADPKLSEPTPDEQAERYVQAAIIRHAPEESRREAAEMLGLIAPDDATVAFGLCKSGHRLTAETTYFYMGSKLCRTCRALRAAGAKS